MPFSFLPSHATGRSARLRAARARLHHVAFKTSSILGFVKTPMALLTSDLVTHPHAHTARHRLPDAGERRQVTISYSASQDEGSRAHLRTRAK